MLGHRAEKYRTCEPIIERSLQSETDSLGECEAQMTVEDYLDVLLLVEAFSSEINLWPKEAITTCTHLIMYVTIK